MDDDGEGRDDVRGRIELISAPWNLGLRPPSPSAEPGAWRAPAALLAFGLQSRLNSARVIELPRPPYEFDPQPATRIRNGVTIREHALALADAVEAALAELRFPVVLGGDCSVLLGCLAGARRRGRCGLLHVDGHSDFFHPGNYDVASRLGAAAGMDLALATGRGELLLTHWPEVGVPLVADDDVFQLGDRDVDTGALAGERETIDGSQIRRLTIQEILLIGIPDACVRASKWLELRRLERVWLHIDVDVLDERVMPAVDSPGSPGLDFAQLAELISRLIATGCVVGLDLTIYDPERDPENDYGPAIVECLASGVAA